MDSTAYAYAVAECLCPCHTESGPNFCDCCPGQCPNCGRWIKFGLSVTTLPSGAVYYSHPMLPDQLAAIEAEHPPPDFPPPPGYQWAEWTCSLTRWYAQASGESQR